MMTITKWCCNRCFAVFSPEGQDYFWRLRKQNGSVNSKTFFVFQLYAVVFFDFFGYVLRGSATPAFLSFSPSSELNDN